MSIIGSLPFTLINGQTADATQVMANFNTIVSSVNASAAASGANSDITALLGLSTPIGTAEGGTGQTSLAAAKIVTASGAFTIGDVPKVADTAGVTQVDGYGVGTAASNLVQLDANAALPAVAGNTLTKLPAAVGYALKAKMSVAVAGATGTFTADAVVVGQTLTGTYYELGNYSQACNLSTTGAGGMDSGAAPASGYVSLYAIAKADGTTNILACNVTTASGSIYSGGSMPTGYIYSALLGIWPTNGSSQFVVGLILDRKFYYGAGANIFVNTNASTSLTSQSLATGVPAAARAADIFLGANTGANTRAQFAVAANATGLAGVAATVYFPNSERNPLNGSAYSLVAAFPDVPLVTAQTVFWADGVAGNGAVYAMYAAAYKV